MNEENQSSYYAVIPATIRYNKEIKSSEKLLYGEITALANKHGYCYAQNRYFADLYGTTTHTVSQWISHLEKLNFIETELIRDSNKEIKERRIYIKDIPYIQKDTYPYVQKSTYPYVSKNTYPMYKKVQENNIKYNIDDIFLYIINKSEKIPADFYTVLSQLDFLYTQEILENMKEDKILIIKNIIYVLFDIYNSKFKNILLQIKRNELVNLYLITQEHSPKDLLSYYKMAIINKYTKG